MMSVVNKDPRNRCPSIHCPHSHSTLNYVLSHRQAREDLVDLKKALAKAKAQKDLQRNGLSRAFSQSSDPPNAPSITEIAGTSEVDNEPTDVLQMTGARSTPFFRSLPSNSAASTLRPPLPQRSQISPTSITSISEAVDHVGRYAPGDLNSDFGASEPEEEVAAAHGDTAQVDAAEKLSSELVGAGVGAGIGARATAGVEATGVAAGVEKEGELQGAGEGEGVLGKGLSPQYQEAIARIETIKEKHRKRLAKQHEGEKKKQEQEKTRQWEKQKALMNSLPSAKRKSQLAPLSQSSGQNLQPLSSAQHVSNSHGAPKVPSKAPSK